MAALDLRQEPPSAGLEIGTEKAEGGFGYMVRRAGCRTELLEQEIHSCAAAAAAAVKGAPAESDFAWYLPTEPSEP